MNLQVKKLIDNTEALINKLREDRDNCKTREGWDAIYSIIVEKLEFIDKLKKCL